MENTTIKSCKECTITLHPLIKNKLNIQDERRLLLIDYMQSNPYMPYLIEQHWDWLIKNGFEINYYKLLDNPNLRAHSFIERHWDWVLYNKGIEFMYLCNSNQTFHLIEKHWEHIKYNKELWSNMGYQPENTRAIEWIDLHWNDIYKYIYWNNICDNPNAVWLIEKHWVYLISENKLIGSSLYANPNAIYLIKHHIDELLNNNSTDLQYLCINSNATAIELIDEYWDQLTTNNNISYVKLYENPNAVWLIDKRWNWLVDNNNLIYGKLFTNPNAIELIEKHWTWLLDNNKIKYDLIASNPNAGPLIKRHWDIFSNYMRVIPEFASASIINNHWDDIVNKIDNISLSNLLLANTSKTYAQVLMNHMDWAIKNIDIWWIKILVNTSSMKIIEQYADAFNSYHITFNGLVKNPALFIDEYHSVAKEWFRTCVTEELMAHVWHPKNINQFPAWGINPDD